MQINPNLKLPDAKPEDRPHLLLWDNPTEVDLLSLLCDNKAIRVSYRQNLLTRLSSHQFLVLHQRLDEEFNAIRSICATNYNRTIILEKLDYLITYLSVQSTFPMELFWQKLSELRHLEAVLWILLPAKVLPLNWPRQRVFHI